MSASETTTLPAPIIDPTPSPPNKWQSEYEAFQKMRPDLLNSYRGQYVVIHNGGVVDSGPNDLALALRFFAQHGNVPVHIGFVASAPEPPIRIPHYREARPFAFKASCASERPRS